MSSPFSVHIRSCVLIAVALDFYAAQEIWDIDRRFFFKEMRTSYRINNGVLTWKYDIFVEKCMNNG